MLLFGPTCQGGDRRMRNHWTPKEDKQHISRAVLANVATGVFDHTVDVESEIGPELQSYVEGDEQLYPMSVQIALARKP
jgi:hypothetical protein